MVLICRIKRIEKVSCAHRLHSNALTDQENKVRNFIEEFLNIGLIFEFRRFLESAIINMDMVTIIHLKLLLRYR